MALAIKYFDTPEFVKRSTELGSSAALAEYQIVQFEQALERAVKSVKAEVGLQELVTKKDLAITKLELQKDIAHIESRLIKWVLGIGVSSPLVLCVAMMTMLKLVLY